MQGTYFTTIAANHDGSPSFALEMSVLGTQRKEALHHPETTENERWRPMSLSTPFIIQSVSLPLSIIIALEILQR